MYTKQQAVLTFVEPLHHLSCSITHIAESPNMCRGEVMLVEYGCTHSIPLCEAHTVTMALAISTKRCLFCDLTD